MKTTKLPADLANNSQLDRWVSFSGDGMAVISTGKVEIGQGVLTALMQIAAEELDIAPERIVLRSGDTALTPNEGNTGGSRSIQQSGIALRLVCAEVRQLFLEHVADIDGCSPNNLMVQNGTIVHGGAPTEHSYWTLADAVNLSREATGSALPKRVSEYKIVGQNLPRIDLSEKVFGLPIFVHDLEIDGMLHARVIRQPRGTASLVSIDEDAIRLSAKGPIDVVQHGNFLALVGENESAVDLAASSAYKHVIWDGVEPLNIFQEEARSLLQQPSVNRTIGTPEDVQGVRGLEKYEATYTRPYLAHASIGPSCGLALYEEGQLQVWTHSQGVYPLRKALARSLKLPVDEIRVKHVQGPGCYGHNGADDVAADAAVIAMRIPGKPIRLLWRREEEFAFEPVGPAMVVKVRAALDDAGKPVDWTTEIWSGSHNTRPGGRGRLLIEDALPGATPAQPASIPPSGEEGGTRNGVPLYDIPSKRIVHHFIPETPVRTSALRGLGAMPNIFSIECFIDELAKAREADPVAYRLSLLTDLRACAVIRRVSEMCSWQVDDPVGTGRARGIAFAQYKNLSAYAAVVTEVEVDENIRLHRVWCAADAGLVINPNGAINQLEGGIIQAASWVLKEQVRLDGSGVATRDWESYPVLRFNEVPEVIVELVNQAADNPPLGVGEATVGPTAAAIGNSVARALGTRLRDLPLTRERVMAALLLD
jgi:nicotinate dehydrogenase subunit B